MTSNSGVLFNWNKENSICVKIILTMSGTEAHSCFTMYRTTCSDLLMGGAGGEATLLKSSTFRAGSFKYFRKPLRKFFKLKLFCISSTSFDMAGFDFSGGSSIICAILSSNFLQIALDILSVKNVIKLLLTC